VFSIPSGNATGFAVTVIGDLSSCGDGGDGGSEQFTLTISEVTTNPPGLVSILDGTGIGGIIGDDDCITLRRPPSEAQAVPTSSGDIQCLATCEREQDDVESQPTKPTPGPRPAGPLFSRAQVPPVPGDP
jgi:hypothetical protein